MGWYVDNSGAGTHLVGTKEANQFGLHDMHGNVWEWCEDVYDSFFYDNPSASDLNPVSTMGSAKRVLRGGSFGDPAESCRSANRFQESADGRFANLGFRPVAPAP